MKTVPRFGSPRQIALGALAFIGLLTLVGCVVTSVYPYFTAKDVVFEPKLVGNWRESDKTNSVEHWEFTRAGTNFYTLVIHDKEKQTEFRAHLFRLKQWTFLDAVPVADHDDYVPPHYLLKVSRMEPDLEMAVMNYKWLGELLDKHPGALRHLRVEEKPEEPDSGRLVLTANTAELQKFILKHAANTNAFADPFTMRRQ